MLSSDQYMAYYAHSMDIIWAKSLKYFPAKKMRLNKN